MCIHGGVNGYLCPNYIILQEVEEDVKTRTKGDSGACKTLCMPFEQPDLPEGKHACFSLSVTHAVLGMLFCCEHNV